MPAVAPEQVQNDFWRRNMLSFGPMGARSGEPEPFPQDFMNRNTIGFGQFAIRPTFPEEPEEPPSASDPWEEHLLEVYRG
jgi:hypothetical protein